MGFPAVWAASNALASKDLVSKACADVAEIAARTAQAPATKKRLSIMTGTSIRAALQLRRGIRGQHPFCYGVPKRSRSHNTNVIWKVRNGYPSCWRHAGGERPRASSRKPGAAALREGCPPPPAPPSERVMTFCGRDPTSAEGLHTAAPDQRIARRPTPLLLPGIGKPKASSAGRLTPCGRKDSQSSSDRKPRRR